MKTYIFKGFILNGSGKVFSLADWKTCMNDYYLPSSRELDFFHIISIDFDKPVSGMFNIKVCSSHGLQQSLQLLRFFCQVNELDICLSCEYICISGEKKHYRKLRVKLDSV